MKRYESRDPLKHATHHRRALEGARRPTRPTVCNAGLASIPTRSPYEVSKVLLQTSPLDLKQSRCLDRGSLRVGHDARRLVDADWMGKPRARDAKPKGHPPFRV